MKTIKAATFKPKHFDWHVDGAVATETRIPMEKPPGCGADFAESRIENRLEEILDESGIRVFPTTTTTGEITISIESEREMLLKFRMLDDEGTAVLSDFLVLEEGKFEQTLDLSFFDKGKYVLQITDGEGTYSKEIVYE